MVFDTQDEFLGGPEYIFTALLDNVKMLCSVLKAINFQEWATFCASQQGLKFTVEQSKCVQASAYISVANFSQYRVPEKYNVEFKVNLTVLTECLNIFGSSEDCSLKMYYKGNGGPLFLVLEPLTGDDVVTDCEIKTQEADELMYFKGDEDVSEQATLLVKGPQLLAVLSDLEKSSEVIQIRISPDYPHFTITTVGPQDESRVEISKTSDMFHSFFCEEAVNLRYKFSHLRLIMRALSMASQVAMKCDSRGVLLVQEMIEKEGQHQMFIEYHIIPLVPDDDDDKEEAEAD